MGTVLPEIPRVRDRPRLGIEEESVRSGGGVIHMDRGYLDAIDANPSSRSERPVVVLLQVEPPRFLPGLQHDLRPLPHVDGDLRVQKLQMVRVVEVDVGDEHRREPRGLVVEASPLEPLRGIQSRKAGQKVKGEVVPQAESRTEVEELPEILRPESERLAHVEPDAGVPVLDEDLVPADLVDPSVARDSRHVPPRSIRRLSVARRPGPR